MRAIMRAGAPRSAREEARFLEDQPDFRVPPALRLAAQAHAAAVARTGSRRDRQQAALAAAAALNGLLLSELESVCIRETSA
jgi:hypothetical protein